MKLIISLFLLFLPLLALSQSDSIKTNTQKLGFSWGAIPALSYDSDLGIKYGAVVNLFDYGKGENYPDYEQYLYLKLTNTTKKTTQLQALLESEKMIKNALIIGELAYFIDKKLDFFGFNGGKTIFNDGFIDKDHPGFIQTRFYSYKRKYLRARFDIQKFLGGKKLRLLTGISYYSYQIDTTNTQNYIESNLSNNLYANYLNWGIIPKNEMGGGKLLNFKFGFIYDDRNDKVYCTDGHWFEAFLVYHPQCFKTNYYLKSVLSYRFYHDFRGDKYSFAGRISLQNKMAGTIPFYNLSTFYDSRLSQEGIGGAYTLRGVMRNRIISDGFALTNLEFKAKVYHFSLLKLNFETAFSVFSDAAYVLQEYKSNLSGVPDTFQNTFFKNEAQNTVFSFGAGLYLVFNKSNIITVNYGISPNPEFGRSALYVGSSMLF